MAVKWRESAVRRTVAAVLPSMHCSLLGCRHLHGVREVGSDEFLEGTVACGCGSASPPQRYAQDLVPTPTIVAHFLYILYFFNLKK